jgi:hypothetical protein
VAVVMICMFGQYTCRKLGAPGSDLMATKSEWKSQISPLRCARSKNISTKGPWNRRSLGSPEFPVESCGFGQLHMVLFKENHIRGRW